MGSGLGCGMAPMDNNNTLKAKPIQPDDGLKKGAETCSCITYCKINEINFVTFRLPAIYIVSTVSIIFSDYAWRHVSTATVFFRPSGVAKKFKFSTMKFKKREIPSPINPTNLKTLISFFIAVP